MHPRHDFLDRFDIDSVVFLMRTHKAYVDHSMTVVDMDNEPIFVPGNVEHDSVSQEASVSIQPLDIGRT